MHPLVVLNVDTLDVSRNASADRVEVDVHLRIVGGFKGRKITPKENTSDDQNNERGNKYPTLVGVALRICGNQRIGCDAVVRRCALLWRDCLLRIRSRILISRIHFPSTYSAKRDSATPVDLARDIF